MPAIYKICDTAHWHAAARSGALRATGADARDGFIHLSTAAQVRSTVERHYARVADLMLIAIDADALSDALRWEPSRGGDLFPHLYGELPLAAVIWARPLPLGEDGRHLFPEFEP
jgi:uncharacterized protein (DUF952 family)